MQKMAYLALATLLTTPCGYGEQVAEQEEKPADQLLVEKADAGELKDVRTIIEKNSNVITQAQLTPAIKAAIENGHAKVVKYLVEIKYADIHAKKPTATTDTGSAWHVVNKAKQEVEALKSQADGKPDVIKVLEKELTKLSKLLDEINEKEETYG